MRRKTQLVVAVTFMVTVVVSFSSYIYVSQILQSADSEHDAAAQQLISTLTSQIAYLAKDAAPDLASTRVNTDDPKAVRRAIALLSFHRRRPERLSGICSR